MDLKDHLLLNQEQLRDAGYDALELRTCGYRCQELKKIGFSARDLCDVGGFDAGEIIRSGYPKDDLKPLGIWPHDGVFQNYNQYWSCCLSMSKGSVYCQATDPSRRVDN